MQRYGFYHKIAMRLDQTKNRLRFMQAIQYDIKVGFI